jgi:hypothetical protein
MARDNGRRENPDIPAKEGEGESDCKSTMDWNQAGVVLHPSSLLHLLIAPLVPPPPPLAQMHVTSRARAAASVALVARNAQLASAKTASAAAAGTAALNAWGAGVRRHGHGANDIGEATNGERQQRRSRNTKTAKL